MNIKRSPALIAISMVAVAVVFFGLLFWAFIAMTALAWTIFVLFIVAIVIGGATLVLRDRTPAFPDERAPALDDAFYRLLVIVEGGGTNAELGAHVLEAAGTRPVKAFVIAPALSSRLDWLTGEQTAYDNATAELDAMLAVLAAAGIDAEGKIGAHEPIQAAADGLREFPANEILVVTSSERGTDGPEHDLVEVLRQQTELPVSRLTA
jgi:hypothetical protein